MTEAPTLPDRLPASTYRLQMGPEFRFADAAATAPYLTALGVTDCYLSPILAAVEGSAHGYDICDHNRVNPALGGEEGFASFASELNARDMGLVLDFVPNHMGIDVEGNLWWRDVLENGPSSPYARYFDIDWNPVKSELRGKLLLPILADQYGVTLDNGELQIEFRQGAFSLRYGSQHLPLNPRELRILLRYNLDALKATLPEDDPDLNEFLSILFHFDHLPPYTDTDPAAMTERSREKEVAKRRLAQLAESSEPIRRHIESNVRRFNGAPGDPASFDLLHKLLEGQVYRLSSWRAAMHEINYRRFFDINALAGIRVEDPELFRAAHELLLRWIHAGAVTGVRLDHVDGLFDPAGYFCKLKQEFGRSVYLVVEKILAADEQLSPDWAVHGTTGYDFLNKLNAVFVDPGGQREFIKLYAKFTGNKRAFRDIVYSSQKLIITTSMASELKVLAAELNRISESNRHFRDFTLDSLQAALVEVVACFPVYRTYFNSEGYDEFDQQNVDLAVREALRRNPAMEPSAFEFIRQMLLPVRLSGLSDEEYQRRVRFAMKFQQYTGPVKAKGLEDTAFYRYGPLISLNEVGGDPSRFGAPPWSFHQANLERQQRWPASMLASSTHDAKRGEDARARINVLSEMPKMWREMISQWSRINASARTMLQGEPAPDRSDEYFFYQTLVGAWPAVLSAPDDEFVRRMRAYMSKATKEKKVHTSWINPSREYDLAVENFVERILVGARSRAFLKGFLPFQQRVARFGLVNSLAQLTLKLASPGVADFYQGAELWDFNLVDPDNRRPVDFCRRRQMLDELLPLVEGSVEPTAASGALSEMLESWPDGRIKQYITAVGLRLRQRNPELFVKGAYIPLEASGDRRDHVVALARAFGRNLVVAIVPRFPVRLAADGPWLPVGGALWGSTAVEIPEAWAGFEFRNMLTRETFLPETEVTARLPLAIALGSSPVALLTAAGEGILS
ncbi:MAG TPA: malto-oligosyltrehalose synthase [Terriglobia bacterium]|nr:malto-oligosyltrehalose synthase [Terriglobia bacterium]